MKKIAYIALLPIFIMQTLGGLVISKIQQHCVQHDMEQALNDRKAHFQKLTLSLQDFQKGKINDHEISFNEKMYDIKSMKITGDKVELLVINDTKEENIIENIKKSVSTNSEQNKKLPSQLVNLLNWFYIYPISGNEFLLQAQKSNYLTFSENISSITNELSSPPPRLV